MMRNDLYGFSALQQRPKKDGLAPEGCLIVEIMHLALIGKEDDACGGRNEDLYYLPDSFAAGE